MDSLGVILREWVIPLVAIFAAIFAGLSAIIAKSALQITRKTQRPFLNVFGRPSFELYPYRNSQTTIYHIDLIIHNSGNYPANRFSIGCSVKTNTGQSHPLSFYAHQPPIPSIVFPSEEMPIKFEENPAKSPALVINLDEELEVSVIISYMNKLTNEKHKTIRSWRNDPKNPSVGLFPYPDSDSWN